MNPRTLDRYALALAELEKAKNSLNEKTDPFFASADPEKIQELQDQIEIAGVELPDATLPYGISDIVAIALIQQGDGLTRLLAEHQRLDRWKFAFGWIVAGITFFLSSCGVAYLY